VEGSPKVLHEDREFVHQEKDVAGDGYVEYGKELLEDGKEVNIKGAIEIDGARRRLEPVVQT
jgi:hypothetical protein